jgi:acyl-CoA reductase-like NAD-dependent aldehyde dehydrogenase
MDPATLKFEHQLYINGKFVDAKSGKKTKIINPCTEEVIIEVAEAGIEDVQSAIEAAREAFDNGPWRKLSAYQRGQVMDKIGHAILDHKDELAAIESLNTGKPLGVCAAFDVDFSGRTFIYYGGWCDKITGTTYEINGPYQGYTFKEPVGVVGQIIPWNFPLLMMAWKLGPALAAGCTVVMKLS